MRRLLRFSLKTVLILTTILCVWVGLWAHRARQQREAVAYLRAVDKLSVTYDQSQSDSWAPQSIRKLLGDDYFMNVTGVHLQSEVSEKGAAEIFSQLQKLRGLRQLVLHNWELNDEDIGHLVELNQISALILSELRKSPSADGMRRLAGMTNIRELYLSGSWLNNDHLRQVARFPSVEKLSLSIANIDDEGLKTLVDCPRLEHLTVFSLRHIETAWPTIARIKKLKKLELLNMYLIVPSDGTPAADRFILRNSVDIDTQSLADEEDWNRFKSWLRSIQPGLVVESHFIL